MQVEEDFMWSWMTVLGRFIGSFTYVGTSKAYGVLLPHLVDQLQSTEGAIGLCGSLFAGLPHIAGTLTTVLVNMYGVRKVVMFGGIVTFLGLLFVAICTNDVQLGICLTITGYCNGFCSIACIMPLTWYFPNNFEVVNGISASGGAIGMMILPPITEFLIQLYGWRGTVALLAALNSFCILSGAIVKEPKHIKRFRLQNKDSDVQKPAMVKSVEFDKRSVKETLFDAIDGHVFEIFPEFIFYQLLFIISGTTISAWILFLVPSSIEKGMSAESAVYLSTIGGVGHIFGRLLQGPLINFKIVTDMQLFGILSFLCAIFFTIDPWTTSYPTYAISAFIIGFSTGAQYTSCLTMTKTLITQSELLLAGMGWTHLSIGTGKLLGGTLVGYLYDASGEYTAPYLTLGGLEIMSLAVVLYQLQKHNFKC